MIQCPSCQNGNPPGAQFCAECGAALALTAEPAPLRAGPDTLAAEGPSAAMPTVAPLHISIFPAAVGLFILGLILGELAAMALFMSKYRGLGSHLPGVAVPWLKISVLVALPWLSTGVGVAVALWQPLRFLKKGRLPSVVGFVFIAAGLLLGLFPLASFASAFGFRYDLFMIAPITFPIGPLMSLWCFSMGLLFPLTFWRRLIQLSLGRKAALAIAAIAGLMVSLWAFPRIEVYGVHGLGEVVALLIGLPAVLVSPILRSQGEAAT